MGQGPFVRRTPYRMDLRGPAGPQAPDANEGRPAPPPAPPIMRGLSTATVLGPLANMKSDVPPEPDLPPTPPPPNPYFVGKRLGDVDLPNQSGEVDPRLQPQPEQDTSITGPSTTYYGDDFGGGPDKQGVLSQIMPKILAGLKSQPAGQAPPSQVNQLQPADFPYMDEPQAHFKVTGRRPTPPGVDPMAWRNAEDAENNSINKDENDLDNEWKLYSSLQGKLADISAGQQNSKFAGQQALATSADKSWQDAQLSGMGTPQNAAEYGRLSQFFGAAQPIMQEETKNAGELGKQGLANQGAADVARINAAPMSKYYDFLSSLQGMGAGANGIKSMTFPKGGGSISFNTPGGSNNNNTLLKDVSTARAKLAQAGPYAHGNSFAHWGGDSPEKAFYRQTVAAVLSKDPAGDDIKDLATFIGEDPELDSLNIDQILQHPKITGTFDLSTMTPAELQDLNRLLYVVRGLPGQ